MAEPALALRRSEDAAHEPAFPLRFVTAASLFDGHDAAINVMRRLLQGSGGEVVHLGHNRAVEEVVTAAIHEDVHAVAVSSYQGGHIEYFRYMLDMLRERGAGHMRIFGGGGGVIVPEEVRELHDYGITRIYTPEDGQRMGLEGMMDDVFERARGALDAPSLRVSWDELRAGEFGALARAITCIERGLVDHGELAAERRPDRAAPVLGITGTGGSGKSSVTDELVRRARLAFGDRLRIAIVAADPTRRRTGGALLGDRIRMNAIDHPGIYMRSLATRASGQEIPATLPEVLAAVQLAGFDLVIVETSGIGQGDAALAPARRREPLRDDPGVRGGEPAREDRHARLRGRGRDQQVRPQGGGGRAPGRAEAIWTKPGPLRRRAGDPPGLRHHRLPVQRRRGERAL